MHLAVIVLAVGLYRAHASASSLGAIGLALAISWAILDIAQSSIVYSAALAAPAADAATIDAVAKGIQNAGHLAGGLWVLTLAAAGPAVFGRLHRLVGIAVGSVFALHVLVVPVLPAWWALEYVGIPIWFAWTGHSLLRGAPSDRTARVAAAPAG